MNQHRFISTLFCAAMVFFLLSCGGGGGSEEKSTTDTTSAKTDTSSATATATQPAASTISTTPQNVMVTMHKVKDFAKWKASYDAHDSMRTASGLHSYVIARGLVDSSMVMVAVKVDDFTKAKAFAKNPSLKKAMQQGGVIGTPTFRFSTMVWRDTATISTDLRSRTTFTVKDFDKWRNAFDSGRQDRMDNGLKDRSYEYDADDNHKVAVVVALTDTAKAKAYWKSDALKKKIAEGGVIGQPQRFLYRVVQVY